MLRENAGLAIMFDYVSSQASKKRSGTNKCLIIFEYFAVSPNSYAF